MTERRHTFILTAPPDEEADHAEALRLEAWSTEIERPSDADESQPRVPRRKRQPDESTDEITGTDASIDEAAFGDAGNGVDPSSEDLAGVPVQPLLEEDPGQPRDIAPDHTEREPGAPPQPDEEDEHLTAKPSGPRPPDPSEWP